LITESELRSIEEYKRNCETERLNWLSQVGALRTQAGKLRTESENSNQLLRRERDLNRKLTLSFNEYEADQFRLMSLKDTRIVKLEAGNELKDKVNFRLIVAVAALGLAWVGYIAFKICRFLKVIPI
jgi:hypothetical protein